MEEKKSSLSYQDDLDKKIRLLEEKNATKRFIPVSKETILAYLKENIPVEEKYPLEQDIVVSNMILIFNDWLEKGKNYHEVIEELYLPSLYGRISLNPELRSIENKLQKGIITGSISRKRMVGHVQSIYAPLYQNKEAVLQINHTLKQWLSHKDIYGDEFEKAKSVGRKQRMLLDRDIEVMQKIADYYLFYMVEQYTELDAISTTVLSREENDSIESYHVPNTILQLDNVDTTLKEYIEGNFLLSNLIYFYQYYQNQGYNSEEILKKITLHSLYGILTEEQTKEFRKFDFCIKKAHMTKNQAFYCKLREKLLSLYIVGKEKKMWLFPSTIPTFSLEDVFEREMDVLTFFQNQESVTEAQVSLLSIDFELMRMVVSLMEKTEYSKTKKKS